MTRVLALADHSKIGCITQRRFAKVGTKTHPQRGAALNRNRLSETPKFATPRVATNYRESGLVVCPACSIAWGWKSPVQPDGGEGLAKHKGVIARWRLKAVWSKTAA